MKIVNDNLHRYVRSQTQNTLGIGKPVPRFEVAQRIELNHFNNMWKSALAQDLEDIRKIYNLKRTLIYPEMFKRLYSLINVYCHHFAVWNMHAYIIQSPFKKVVLNNIFNGEDVLGHSVIVMQSDITRKEVLIAKKKNGLFSVLTREVQPIDYLMHKNYTLLPLCNYLNEHVVNKNMPDGDLGIFANKLWSKSYENVISQFWFQSGIEIQLSTKEEFKKFGYFTREELKLILRHLRKTYKLEKIKQEVVKSPRSTFKNKQQFDKALSKAVANSPLKKYQSSPSDTLFNLVQDIEEHYSLIVQTALEYFVDEHKQEILKHKDDFEFLKQFFPFPLKSTYDDWESHCERLSFVLQFERDIDLRILLED